MSKQANPTLIGGFVVGAAALVLGFPLLVVALGVVGVDNTLTSQWFVVYGSVYVIVVYVVIVVVVKCCTDVDHEQAFGASNLGSGQANT